MEYKQCARCVMDNIGDSTIKFDDNGVCNYCSDALRAKNIVYHPNDTGKDYLEKVFGDLKRRRKDYKYDCMLGLSGGLDSSYAAYVAHTYGLRMLAVHVDDGLDAPVTTDNVKKICDAYGIDLVIENPDPILFGDLTCAFIRAGVPNIAIPQDNVLFACLYKYAKDNQIDCFLNGSNFALESILQRGNTYDASDKRHILAIWKRFGQMKDYANLPLMSVFEKRVFYGYIHKILTIKPLNYVEYNAQEAFNTLHKTCGFEYYGDKHCESIFTKIMQRYYLPKKFNVDKRKSHYSSMIISGQMTREDAIKRLGEQLYNPNEFSSDLDFVLGKIGMSKKEFNKVMHEEGHNHSEYPMSIINSILPIILDIRKRLTEY
ncbi:N-acetyl sugar amidotransferase [Cloacibacillus porcorum]